MCAAGCRLVADLSLAGVSELEAIRLIGICIRVGLRRARRKCWCCG